MEYVVTWAEGEEVCYRFVSENEIKDLLEADKPYIIASLALDEEDPDPLLHRQ